MAKALSSFEVYGKENIPEDGMLVVPNQLAYQDLRHLEKFFYGRKLVYLIETDMDYPPLLRDYLEERDEVMALEFSCQDDQAATFRKSLAEHIDDEALVIFVPGTAQVRPGQTIAVPTKVLKFLTSAKASILPMFVEHPEETCLSTENRLELERIVLSFGRQLPRESANLANFTEEILVAAEKAYANRPILQSHLAYEVIKGLKKHSNTTSLTDGVDESVLRFDKMLAAAITLSKMLKQETKKERIGVILPAGKGGMVANLAVLLANKVPVNLNFKAGESAIKSSIAQADLDKFITATPFMDKVPEFAWPEKKSLILLDQVLPPMKLKIAINLIKSKFKSADGIARSLGIPRKGGDKEAVLLFTSGSSGDPKGVVLSHRNILANVNQFGGRLNLLSDDSVLGCLPLFHSFGCTVTMWYPMIEGIDLVTFPNPLDTPKLAELIEKYRVSLLLATPTFLRGYLRRAEKDQLASLKMVVTGAEKLPNKVAESFERRFGKKVYEGYGLTETSPVTNINLPSIETMADPAIPEISNHRQGSVGLFIPGVAVRIKDPETSEPLSLHDSGMIWLKGANVFEGYLNQPEKTAEVKRRNDWFITGDIGRVDEDGFLHIEGRLSRFSKIAGEMVPHETIEVAIYKSLAISDESRKITVVGLPDEAKGEILVLLSTDDINMTELRTELSKAGIVALWIPKKIVRVDEIPILASGKLDIKGCVEIAKANV